MPQRLLQAQALRQPALCDYTHDLSLGTQFRPFRK
jgi:hypothetical protein